MGEASNVVCDFFVRCVVSQRYESQGMDYKFLLISKKPKRGGGNNGRP